MGRYINPEQGTKEQWLRNNGIALASAPLEFDFTEHLPVCLVDNGAFAAAAIATTEDELVYFRSPSDLRPKKWFAVKIDILRRSGFIN